MKTADGVPFVNGMTLWTLEGESFQAFRELSDYDGGGLWVKGEKDLPSGRVSCFYSSKEAREAFFHSKVNSCFVCNKVQMPLYGEGNHECIRAVEGTVFRSVGNFGSTVFDPMDDSLLEIIICDDCFRNKTDQMTLYNKGHVKHGPNLDEL